jgi:hypothetical protein
MLYYERSFFLALLNVQKLIYDTWLVVRHSVCKEIEVGKRGRGNSLIFLTTSLQRLIGN